ncbi:ABC transporter substrate-binding protein [Aquincola sp. MAHUQ-54]|uniref:ABC transporter substrate-binding protein n=1 Tax=Aquincola agrisoli TaxID=3119538 RepID=A0AAW9Q881_9BURK
MKRRALLAALPCAAAVLPAVGPAPAFAQPAPRVVTVGGALTEIVYLLGAQAQLAGTDTTSVHPEAALHTPKVGYQRQLSAEGLLSLRPDVVVSTDEAGPPVALAQLRSAGVRLALLHSSHDIDDLRRKILAVGRATGRLAQAEALQRQVDAQWQSAQAAVRAALQQRGGSRPKVLFVLAHGGSPQVSGHGTAAHAMIELAGGANALQGFQGYRPMTAEAVVAAAPELVLTTRQAIEAAGGADRFWEQPGLPLTPAGRRRALYAPDALALLGFGPRLPAAVADLAAVLAGLRG